MVHALVDKVSGFSVDGDARGPREERGRTLRWLGQIHVVTFSPSQVDATKAPRSEVIGERLFRFSLVHWPGQKRGGKLFWR